MLTICVLYNTIQLHCLNIFSFYATKIKPVIILGEWDKAHTLASQYLEPEEVTKMYITQARTLEEQGKLREAEKLYVYVSEPDMAISMYKKHRQYEQVCFY